MDKFITFKHTKDGMLSVDNERNPYMLVSELKSEINELIRENERILANYSDVIGDSEVWRRIAKAEYESKIDVLNKLRQMIY